MGRGIQQPISNIVPDRGAATPCRAGLALLLLVPAPSIGAWCAMHWLPDTALGQSIHLSAKAWLLALPIAWGLLIEPGRLRLPHWSWDGMTAGMASGLLILGVILGGWELFGRSMVEVEVFREKMAEVGLSTPMRYLAFAAAVTFVNALLEEYVWRWFVYSKWLEVLGGSTRAIAIPGAIVLAGLCFVSHHSLAMSLYFDWQANTLASLGIFIGSVTWSAIYLRYKNIYAAYVSHIFADIALFYVGYRIAFG